MENSVTLQGRGTRVLLGPAQHARDARSLHVPQLTNAGGISELGTQHTHLQGQVFTVCHQTNGKKSLQMRTCKKP